MITLHTLKKHPKSSKRRKVVGRGLGSGHGTYSTRGGKGQTARTGHSKMPAGFEGGRQPLIRQLPKNRGFKQFGEPVASVRLKDLALAMPEGGVVNLDTLKKLGIVRKSATAARLVGKMKLTAKYVLAIKASASAYESVKQAGGKVK